LNSIKDYVKEISDESEISYTEYESDDQNNLIPIEGYYE
jgi:hypothetical protein